MYVLGVAGPIASGKTLLLSLFSELGAETLRADVVARELVRPGSPLLAEIVNQFGEEFLTADGKLDRERMGRLVFQDGASRSRYDALFHPALHKALVERIAAARDQARAPVLVVEAAIMGQLRLADQLDGLVYVDAPEDVRVERLVERNGGSAGRALARVRAQTAIENLLEHADWVVDGCLEPMKLRGLVARIYQDILTQEASNQ